MDQKLKIVFVLALATVRAGVVPAPRILEGPSSKTTLVGPDGSKISAFAPGGKIVLDENPGPVLQGAPEVVAVAGVAQPAPDVVADVAQPPPVVQTQVVEEIAPVAAVVEEIKPVTETESEPVEAISTPTGIVAKSVVAETNAHVEDTIVAQISTEPPNEEVSEPLEIVESATNSPTAEKITETPFNVVPLAKEIQPVVVRAVDPKPVGAYIHDSPLYVSEVSPYDGHYIPENLFEEEILGW